MNAQHAAITKSEVEEFIHHWFRELDVHKPVEEMLTFVADEKLLMRMPEGQYLHYEGFERWYRGVEKYRSQSHTVKAIAIEIDHDTATVKLINRWERADVEAENPSARLAFYAAQTWTLERPRETQTLLIVASNIDYFLHEYGLA